MWPIRFGSVFRFVSSRVKVHGGGGCRPAAAVGCGGFLPPAAGLPPSAAAWAAEELCRLLVCDAQAMWLAAAGLRRSRKLPAGREPPGSRRSEAWRLSAAQCSTGAPAAVLQSALSPGAPIALEEMHRSRPIDAAHWSAAADCEDSTLVSVWHAAIWASAGRLVLTNDNRATRCSRPCMFRSSWR